MRPASPSSHRHPRPALQGEPAQYVLPFSVENAIPRSEKPPDQRLSSQLSETQSTDTAAQPGDAKKEPARKPSRPSGAGHTDHAPASAPPRSQRKHIVSPARVAPSGSGAARRADLVSVSVSPNIVDLIENRAEAWSAPELARLIGCTGKHIYALAKSGRMPHLRIGGMVRFDPATTAEWLRQRYIAA